MNSKYQYDQKSLMQDGARWFPIMGEIHYSRIPQQYWKEALLKMKAGGVDIVSSYVIWIHHEEIEGEWNFEGERDLRTFVELIKECGLSMILRIGPWCHGEVRNGGFPDWLLHKNFQVRTNDENYFEQVDILYKKIFSQVAGLLYKDGGPIIGVQIENEFGHCGGLSGVEGEKHMRRLYEMARADGFMVPFYTATGWGGAVTAGLLPVMGGYCDAPWDPRPTEIEPSGNYVFTYERNDHAIGCDYGLGEGITFNMDEVPYLTAELGGGLQVTYKRRPVATSNDIGAMSLVKMGSGCNLLGYYMYHGGTNPHGKRTTLEENTATGYPNDLPVLNYDFRAPVGEYGETNDTFKEIRLLALFVHEWGEALCNMDAHIPEDNPLHPADTKSIRYSWRYQKNASGNSGLLFVTNYVRHQKMAVHQNVVFALPGETAKKVTFPAITIPDGAYFFLPFNMRMGKNCLHTALATPLTVLHNKRNAYVFYTSAVPRKESSVTPVTACDSALYQFDGTVTDDCDVVTLTRNDALNATVVDAARAAEPKQYLVMTDGTVTADPLVDDGSRLSLFTRTKPMLTVWPKLERVPEHFRLAKNTGAFFEYAYDVSLPPSPDVTYVLDSQNEQFLSYRLALMQWPVDSAGIVNDVILKIAYTGNAARLYEDGTLIADHLYIGPAYEWEVGLRRFGKGPHTFVLEIDALTKEKPLYLEKWPLLKEGRALSLDRVSAVPTFKVNFSL